MKIFLETKRLIIKTPDLSDFDNLYLLQSDPVVMEFIGEGVRTKQEVAKSLQTAIDHQQKHGFSLCNVFEKESNTFVGRAGIIYLAFDDTQPEIEVGYALLKPYWNKGYATELTHALIKWGFENLSVDYLVGVIKPKNERSRHVLEKAGMRYIKPYLYRGHEVAYYQIDKNKITYAKIQLIPATLQEYPVIQNMGRFYVYDMSEYMGQESGWEMPDDGLFECIDFKKYWQDQSSFPFLIKYDDELVGFVIIDKKGSDARINFNMAQFFILRKFKNKGIGQYVACQCFDKFPGTWEVMVMPGNEGAYRFWRSVIRHYSHHTYQEYSRNVVHLGNSIKNIFKFKSNM